MSYPLLSDEVTFEIDHVLSAVPTRVPETGEPRLDVHLVQGDGGDAYITLLGARAVAVVTDLRRRRATGDGRTQLTAA